MDAIAEPTRQLVRLRGPLLCRVRVLPRRADRGLARRNRRHARALARLLSSASRSCSTSPPSTSANPPSPISSPASNNAISASSASRASTQAHVTTSMPPLLTGGRHCVLSADEPRKSPKPSRSRRRCCSKARCAPVSRSSSPKATSPCWVRSAPARRSSPAARSISTARFAAARWRASTAIPPRGSTARRSKPSCLAIDGYYQTAEEIDASLRNRPAQAWLEGDIMKITPLN